MDEKYKINYDKGNIQSHKPSSSGVKEAINLDTPDINTGGLNVVWTNYDCTPNLDIILRSNSFKNLERAIGTHKYSEGEYHENIQILDNTIEDPSGHS